MLRHPTSYAFTGFWAVNGDLTASPVVSGCVNVRGSIVIFHLIPAPASYGSGRSLSHITGSADPFGDVISFGSRSAICIGRFSGGVYGPERGPS
jgi:hypothetical protein